MAPTVTVTITMGNDRMRTLDDVARCLHEAALRLSRGDGYGNLRDDNGNVVGEISGPTRKEIEALDR